MILKQYIILNIALLVLYIKNNFQDILNPLPPFSRPSEDQLHLYKSETHIPKIILGYI